MCGFVSIACVFADCKSLYVNDWCEERSESNLTVACGSILECVAHVMIAEDRSERIARNRIAQTVDHAVTVIACVCAMYDCA